VYNTVLIFEGVENSSDVSTLIFQDAVTQLENFLNHIDSKFLVNTSINNNKQHIKLPV
jgi:hypothetical protein